MTVSPPSVPCKVCGGSAVERLQLPEDRHPHQAEAVGRLVPYFGCPACGFLFATHLDAPGAHSPYDEDYFEDTDLGSAARADLPLRLVRQAEGWLGRRYAPVLDFGSGVGEGVARMREAGLEAYGVDIVAPRTAEAHIRVGALDEQERYGAVTAIEVFEHLPDPLAAAGAIARALKPMGLLALTTELHDPATLDPTWWYLAPGAGHISLFTRRSLARLAQRSGFHVLLSTPTNHLLIKGPLAPWQVWALRARIGLARLKAKLRPAGR